MTARTPAAPAYRYGLAAANALESRGLTWDRVEAIASRPRIPVRELRLIAWAGLLADDPSVSEIAVDAAIDSSTQAEVSAIVVAAIATNTVAAERLEADRVAEDAASADELAAPMEDQAA